MAQATQTNRAGGELLLAGTIPGEDFVSFIQAYTGNIFPDSPALALLENQPRYVVRPQERQNLLQFAAFNSALDFTSYTTYTSGRIFHAQSELRWERQHAHMHVVFTGARTYRPGLKDAEEIALDDCEKVPRAFFLFGKRLDDRQIARIGPVAQSGDFVEVRIPRLLRYPQLPTIADAERVQLAMYEYVDPTTGASVAYRIYDLVPFHK
jgi:hypothetical protein